MYFSNFSITWLSTISALSTLTADTTARHRRIRRQRMTSVAQFVTIKPRNKLPVQGFCWAIFVENALRVVLENGKRKENNKILLAAALISSIISSCPPCCDVGLGDFRTRNLPKLFLVYGLKLPPFTGECLLDGRRRVLIARCTHQITFIYWILRKNPWLSATEKTNWITGGRSVITWLKDNCVLCTGSLRPVIKMFDHFYFRQNIFGTVLNELKSWFENGIT